MVNRYQPTAIHHNDSGEYVKYTDYAYLECLRDTACKVMQELADELGCKPDNEVILQAIEDLKSKAAELEKQRDGLVAENAALKELYVYNGLTPKTKKHKLEELKKSFINKMIYSAEYYSVCGHISAATNRSISAVHGDYSWMPDTSQTDAAMAEIGAKAIRDCAESLLANDDIGIEHEYPLMLSYANKLRGGGA